MELNDARREGINWAASFMGILHVEGAGSERVIAAAGGMVFLLDESLSAANEYVQLCREGLDTVIAATLTDTERSVFRRQRLTTLEIAQKAILQEMNRETRQTLRPRRQDGF